MSTATEGRPFTPRVSEALADSASRIAGSFSAQRLWERHLTVQDRERLGGDCRAAYKRLGTAGMWSKLRGVTPYRAVVDVANKLDLLSDSDREWLLREIGEDVDAEEAKLTAIANGDLVVVETPREAYWNGNEIEIDWNRHSAKWDFFWELVRRAKAGRPVDSFAFSDDTHRDFVTKQKSRLCKLSNFPVELVSQIEPVSRGTQRLMIPRERIHVFELDGVESLREWLP